MVALHDQADVLALGQAGAFPLLIVDEQVGGAGGDQEGLNVTGLAVADDGQVIAPGLQGFHDGAETGIEGAAVGVKVFHLITAAKIEDLVPAGNVDVRVEGEADLLHRHAHDAVNVVHGQGLQTGTFPLKDLVPGFSNGRGRIPEGSVEIEKEERVLHKVPPVEVMGVL